MTTDANATSPKRMGCVRSAGVMTLVTVVLFAVLEGAASMVLAVHTLLFQPVEFMAEERAHTEYDELLGWIHLPDLLVPDMYGPGVYLQTNSQRFRAKRDYAHEVPPGRVRVVCSGDSFTLGHSVDNDHAWCSLLEQMEPRFETLNMGQAAYGIDQAFLWYRRDGAPFQHDVHVFAFITSDFERMGSDDFGGYPKPYLTVVDGEIRVENTPVPRRMAGIPRRERMTAAVRGLSTVELGQAVLGRLGLERDPAAAPPPLLSDDEVRVAAAAVFEELQRLNDAKGSSLFLTYLPRTGDKDAAWSDPWREFVASEAERLGVGFIDLVAEFRELSLDAGEQMFVLPYRPSHYDESGNQWVADHLLERLLQDETIRRRLDDTRTGEEGLP